MRGVVAIGGIVLVLGLLAALFYMRGALDIFVFRKATEALRERRPIRWRDPEAWETSKRLSGVWVGIVGLYLLGTLVLSSIFPDPNPAWAALYALVPLLIMPGLRLSERDSVRGYSVRTC